MFPHEFPAKRADQIPRIPDEAYCGGPNAYSRCDVAMLDRLKPDLVVLSPGPGIPKDFDVSGTLAALEQRGLLWHRSWGGSV
jgi:hypothetical protein